MNNVRQSLHALFIACCAVLPGLGNDEVPLTAVPIVRTSLVPPAAIEETIDTPAGHHRGLKPIKEMCVKASPTDGPLPEDYSGGYFPDETVQLDDMRKTRDWPLTEYHWQAPNVCHRPLYFDHPSLELCGQSVEKHLQPLLSGTRFFVTIPLLPLKIAQTPPHVEVSSPGICGPRSPTSFVQQECEPPK